MSSQCIHIQHLAIVNVRFALFIFIGRYQILPRRQYIYDLYVSHTVVVISEHRGTTVSRHVKNNDRRRFRREWIFSRKYRLGEKGSSVFGDHDKCYADTISVPTKISAFKIYYTVYKKKKKKLNSVHKWDFIFPLVCIFFLFFFFVI